VRVLDAVDVRSTSIRRAQAGGVTTANVMPGSGHLLSGQTIYLKLRRGNTIEDLEIMLPDGRVAGGLKMANGTNSIRATGSGPFPGTRAKSAALVREQFIKAVEYRDKVRKAAGDASKLPARDLAMEALIEVLDGKRTVHFHTHRHDDIITVIRLSQEFGFKPVLQHVSEGWKVADEIAKAGLAASLTVVDSPGGKLETLDVAFRTAAVLDKAGVLVGFNTDDPITDSRIFLRSAGLAVRAGLSRDKALYAMTMAGARMLGLDSRIGSLEAGKDADFLVLSGDPLSVYTHVEQTWVEGKKVFDRSVPEDRLFATGGYGAGRGQALHLDDEADEDGGRE
jgi:imidazolonepropionase-like amidohydrolase